MKIKLATTPIAFLAVVLAACGGVADDSAVEASPTEEAAEPATDNPVATATVESEESIEETPTTVPTEPAADSSSDASYRVAYSSVSIRNGPGTNFDAIGYLYQDDIITPVDQDSDPPWYKIVLEDGTEGWVAASVVEPVEKEVASTREQPETDAEPDTFGELTITNVSIEDATVTVRGTTDLPDGAVLWVYFDVGGQVTSILPIDRPRVSGGEFSSSFTPATSGAEANGPHLLSVKFLPLEQSSSVKTLVGPRGANLSGPNLVESTSGGASTLEVTHWVESKLAANNYSMLAPTDYATGSPERALAEYLNAWQRRDWQQMVQFTQKTWRVEDDDPALTLEAWHDFKDLLGAEIIDTRVNSNTSVAFTVKLTYATTSVEVSTVTAMVIRESTAYQPSASGDWGVNPISTLNSR